ncbi:hypothetical protein [Streptomyces sp. Ru87]|uniref:hypothetical protein n=1 Tax=Streptomyces sp. Ru87 TaxID=2044307 RepID=UPI000BF879F1|nr:hypothetical protein [Streptomyces sp. Ru87]PGH49312.1 hypothetical protein CRI70_18405 [Streptomyces sp. Ru87]
MSEPLAAVDTWKPVMEAAGFRCQCAGECGKPHDKTEDRCPREHDTPASKHGSRIRLLAAPADPGMPAVKAVTLPPSQLRAWCPACYAAATRLVRRAVVPVDEPGLFDLPEGSPS